MSALAQDRPTFLRYQGIIDQVSGELPDAIDCSFYLKNSNDDQLWSERHDTVYALVTAQQNLGLGLVGCSLWHRQFMIAFKDAADRPRIAIER